MSSRYIPTDPLFSSQWHLLNNGQDIMGLPQATGAYRNDINVTEVWQDYNGKGVVVGVLDDGFQAQHPDLAPNLLLSKFFNVETHKPGSIDGAHGTATMGLILADQNSEGGIGVAFGSKGIGYKINGTVGDPMLQSYIASVPRMIVDGVDINSNSWGPTLGDTTPFNTSSLQSSYRTAQIGLAQLGRDGLGIVSLFAAGNGRTGNDNTVYSPTTNSPYAITVAAANTNGTVASYSTPGPNVLVASPGSGGSETGSNVNDVASIVTTDLLGIAGYNKTEGGDYSNLLDESIDSRGFNGTSAATPIAAGVVALMLEANPNLGYRDVQEILAYSARTPDGVATWKTNGATDWNGGGHRFNSDLGFGLIDARAAVRLAETWDKQSTFGNLTEVKANFTNPDDGVTIGAGSTLDLTANFQETVRVQQAVRVQHVTVAVQMRMDGGTDNLSDVTLTLKGPDGKTITALMDSASYRDFEILPGNITYTFDSVQNWGEISNNGNWTLSVSNASTSQKLSMAASISLLGDLATDGQKFVYTDDYAHLASSDTSRAVLSATTTGPHTLNAAAVTGNTVIDLAQDQATIAGVATHIGDSMQFASLITGDGNDRLTGVDTADSMTAGRGDDTLHGGGGQDTLSGGRGDDQIFGQDGNDSVLGGEGNDFGSGGFGSDTVIGGAGNDLLFGDDDSDLIDGSEGDDIVHGGTGVDTMFGSAGNDQVYGEDGADFLGAGEGHDFGSGGFGNDEVHGEGGNDLLFGDDGNDGVYGEDGDDLVYGGTGNDYLTGDAGNDRLFGEADDDGLSGGAGNDTLDGGAGADLLFGNAGDDVLTGGAGADVFAFGAGDGLDRILDFVLGGSEADVIAFNGGAFADFAGVQAASRQDGTDVVIAYGAGAGDALTLAGVQLGSLSVANFTFA